MHYVKDTHIVQLFFLHLITEGYKEELLDNKAAICLIHVRLCVCLFSFSVSCHVAGRAQIAGPAEVHVRQGSTLSLSCSLKGAGASGPDSSLAWYHDDQPVLLETAKNSLSLATERADGFLSLRLLLPRASAVDGGNYTCVPSEALPASVLVHVLNGTPN